MAEHSKLVIIATHGPQDPELATLPFVVAVAALASDVETVMAFQADGVCLMHEGEASTVQAPEFPPLAKLDQRLPRARRFAPRVPAMHQEPWHHRHADPGHRSHRRRAPRGRSDLGHQHPRLLVPKETTR